ncbi:guanylate kinase [Clostridium aminobutyricum]|uniref:Guanylate kinase n=1 Tax=Clostridium aminobutyricum TaxID=33953 RepID=A0A939II42_CLOAM|nr:guanylate kinase [Clostridium aminobutyricum]MBN7772109.1 guanylate kinase [Clostridium aminobutyricum]
MDKGHLFVVSGPSGAGKGTICQKIVEQTDVELSISMTTRDPRSFEEHGANYYFVSKEEFLETIENNGLLEYAEVYGNFYGTPKKLVMEKLNAGRDVILEIDIQGAMKVKQSYPGGVFIFILPPSMTELRKRITGRGSESEDAINMRLGETLKEVSYIDKYDYCVVNGELDEAVNRVQAIIIAEHSKVSESIYHLIKKYEEEI